MREEKNISKLEKEVHISRDILEDFIFEEPREFSLKDIQGEFVRRGGNNSEEAYNILGSEIIDYESRGVLFFVESKNKYLPKGIYKKNNSSGKNANNNYSKKQENNKNYSNENQNDKNQTNKNQNNKKKYRGL